MTPNIYQKVKAESEGKGTCFEGEAETTAYRLVLMVRACYMELATGMRVSRHVKATALAAREFGLKGSPLKRFARLCEIVGEKTGCDYSGLIETLREKGVK